MTTHFDPRRGRAERLLLPAAFVTSLGNNIQLIAAALLVVRTERSMLDVGWLFIAVAVPQAVLSPYFGRLADRFDRRALWVGCDVAGAVAALALPVGIALGWPGTAVTYASNFALAAISALFVPASTALVKERVRPAALAGFNAHYEMAMQAGMLLSASAGGFALQYLGAAPLFVFNSATFLVSAACVLAVGDPERGAGTAPAATPPDAGVPRTAAVPLARLILLYAQGSVVVTVFNALLPVLVIVELHRGAAVVGVVDALGGAGFLVAAASYRLVGRRLGDQRIALAGFLLGNVLLVLQPRFGVPGLLACVPVGAAVFGQARIASRTLLMAGVDNGRVGRVFGLANAYGLVATVVVMLGVSAVTDHSDARYGFAALAAVSTAAALAAAAVPSRRRLPPGVPDAGPVLSVQGGELPCGLGQELPQ